ncbi:hypothetical protein [Legionella waltersii]|uniref:Uncharacterized protein n=1 Tax=Legionella waltersii TaxID=66969 RepID=A0A0W1ALG6_9GAMM|nr:hypothetical protein [Legionella waltersii]KTD82205.1 hypothetical protein Lwal_0682 [Legionella waltersii]SNV10709.1 Uncharacterised protein [Legionella waltersii]
MTMGASKFFEIKIVGSNNSPEPSDPRQIFIKLADVDPATLPYQSELSGETSLPFKQSGS